MVVEILGKESAIMKYETCDNCAHNSDSVQIKGTKCENCNFIPGTLCMTHWKLQEEKVDMKYYTHDQVNFPALRSAIQEAMRERSVSEHQFKRAFGKAINTVLKWITAKKIMRSDYDRLCVWLQCSKTIFITKLFKKRVPYYAKSDHCRMAGRTVK